MEIGYLQGTGDEVDMLEQLSVCGGWTLMSKIFCTVLVWGIINDSLT